MSEIYINGEAPLPTTRLQQIARLILESEMPQVLFRLSLSIVDDEEMRRYNKLYRGLDKATDVLSFVSSQFSAPPDPELKDSEKRRYNSQVLCDILIDIKQLDRQRAKNTLESEFISVYIHGLLHLVGYDHIRSSDAKKMKEKEEHYLKVIQGDI